MIAFDRAWLPLAACFFAFFAALNYHDFLTVNLDWRYYWFGTFIQNGFSLPTGTTAMPTFPMWGYGWLLAITTNRATLLTIQAVLALASVAMLVEYLERSRVLPLGGLRVFKTLLLISVPWYAQHVVLWPNSVAVSLTLMSLVLLAQSTEPREATTERQTLSKVNGPWVCTITSGLLFGVALNFRSDFWLYPLAVAPVIIYFSTSQIAATARAATWIAVIVASLVPWMIYTRSACGHFVPTSTNSGHVVFIGLGNLPGNIWGITLDDYDPVMHRTVAKHFGSPQSTFTYEADQFLKHEYFRLVRENPGEYAKKCVYALGDAITSGSYIARFYRRSDEDRMGIAELPVLQREFIGSPVNFIRTHGLGFLVRLGCTAVNDRLGKLLVVLGYLSLVPVILIAVRRRQVILFLGLLAIFYQTAIVSLVGMIPMYMSNIHVWHLLSISLTLWSLNAIARRMTSRGQP